MKITLVAVGTKMPQWVETPVLEYTKRLPANFKLNLIEVSLVKRSKNSSIEKCRAKESESLLAHVAKGDYLVALDAGGKQFTTASFAKRIDALRQEARNITMLVGGPDGFAESCLERCDEKWSLSALTLPHPLVRVVLAEQVYRAWSLLSNHPYHRE